MLSIQITKDQSPTLFSDKFQQTYHSIHGAIAESEHIFIKYGLAQKAKKQSEISIFEMGLGTGLNAALSWQYAEANNLVIDYHAIELYPVESNIIEKFKTNNSDLNKKIIQISQMEWSQNFTSPNFNFTKEIIDLKNFKPNRQFDLVYFDAFAPNAQPELWTEDIFSQIYSMMLSEGILTTYCAKGQVKRNMKAVQFTLLHPPGPIGKREMTVATKIKRKQLTINNDK